MVKNFVIIRTGNGRQYANKIIKSIRWLNENKYPEYEFRTFLFSVNEFYDEFLRRAREFTPDNTIIHARVANPKAYWTIQLRKLEEHGFRVINPVDTLELTSNKLECALLLQDKVNHPKSWEYRRDMTNPEFLELYREFDAKLNDPEYIIAKPFTSVDQGANVKKIKIDNMGIDRIRINFDTVPGDKIVIQEYIPYTALHRVIVINGEALPYTFIDKPEWHKEGDWKVSCCLNRTTMKLKQDSPYGVLELAEMTQTIVGGSINFIDIFETEGYYTIGEINTACNLTIHEKLARDAGRKDWNIHYRIAKYLVEEII